MTDMNARYSRMYKLYKKYKWWFEATLMREMILGRHFEWRFEPAYRRDLTITHRAQYPRRRKINFENVDPNAVECLRDWYGEHVIAYTEDRGWTLQRLKRQLKEFAPLVDQTPLPELVKVKVADTSNWGSQGMGQNKYARESLSTDKQLLEAAGHTVEVRKILWRDVLEDTKWQGDYDVYAYELWATAEDYMLHALTYGYSLLDWATDCWKRGVNPKVYHPFLPDDIWDQSLIGAGFTP